MENPERQGPGPEPESDDPSEDKVKQDEPGGAEDERVPDPPPEASPGEEGVTRPKQ